MNEAGVGVGAGYFQCMNFSKKNPLPKCTTSFHRTFYTTYIKKTRKGDRHEELRYYNQSTQYTVNGKKEDLKR